MENLFGRYEAVPADWKRDLIDIIAFLAIVELMEYVVTLLAGSQSQLGAVVGVFGSVAVAWGLLIYRGEGWRAVGLRTPKPLWMVPVWILVVCVVAYGVNFVGPLLGETANLERFAPLHGNLGLYLKLVASIFITSALIEELVFRGFLLSRLAGVLGPSVAGLGFACLIQAVIFGVAHAYQGIAGIVLTGIFGFFAGVIYFLAGRNLWALIVAHGIVDSFGLTRIFLFGLPES